MTDASGIHLDLNEAISVQEFPYTYFSQVSQTVPAVKHIHNNYTINISVAVNKPMAVIEYSSIANISSCYIIFTK